MLIYVILAVLAHVTLNTFTEYSYTREIRYYAITRWTNICDVTHINRSCCLRNGCEKFFYVRVSLNSLLINNQMIGICARHVLYNYFTLTQSFVNSRRTNQWNVYRNCQSINLTEMTNYNNAINTRYYNTDPTGL